MNIQKAIKLIKSWQGLEGKDLASKVTCKNNIYGKIKAILIKIILTYKIKKYESNNLIICCDSHRFWG